MDPNYRYLFKSARKFDDLITLKANIGKYIHFSNSDRFGISFHKDIHPGNPRAVYGFPFTEQKYKQIEKNNPEAFYNYGYNKYIYIFDVVGNILNMDSASFKEVSAKVRNFVRENLKKSSYHIIYDPSAAVQNFDSSEFLKWLGLISRDLFKNTHSGINILLRGIGYDAIETRDYGFGDDIASEIAVLNPTSINLIAKVNNPMLSKEDIDWINSDQYEQKQKEILLIEEKQKRLKTHQQYEAEKKIIEDMEKELRNERRKKGITPEYLEKLELHLKLFKEFNKKWLNVIF